jgi:hypothetical protein
VLNLKCDYESKFPKRTPIRKMTRLHGTAGGNAWWRLYGTRRWAVLFGISAIIAALLRPGCDLLAIKGHADAGAGGIVSSSVHSDTGLEYADLDATRHGESHDTDGCCSSIDEFVLVSAQEAQVPISAKAQWNDLPLLATPRFHLTLANRAAGHRIQRPAQLPVLFYHARSARLLL